jgi:hypothetical protein
MKVNKKLIALPLLIAIALSIAGFAYAHWSDEIKINGEIHMGSLTLAFIEIEPPVEYYWKGGVRYPGEPMGKDVATTTSTLEEPITDPHSGKSGWKKLGITITNGYPEYEVHCTFIIDNIGTTPLDIVGFNIYDPTGTFTWVSTGVGIGYFTDASGKPMVDVELVNTFIPYQLDPCNKDKMEIDIHLKEDALECHTYQFVVEILYSQWN